LLLSSLAAGCVATFLTPPYRDIAAMANELKAAPVAQESRRPHASDMSGVHARDNVSRTL
jgi:hypothetical protein